MPYKINSSGLTLNNAGSPASINGRNFRVEGLQPVTGTITGIVPYEGRDVWMNNSQLTSHDAIVDGNLLNNYGPVNQLSQLIYPNYDLNIELDRFNTTVSNVAISFGGGSGGTTSTQVLVVRADNDQEVSLGTWTQNGYQQTDNFPHSGTFKVRRVILRATTNPSYGAEVRITGTYTPPVNPLSKVRRPINWLTGANGHVWDIMNDAKINAILDMKLKSLRLYDYAYDAMDISGNWRLNIYQGSDRYRIEDAFTILKTADPEIKPWRALNNQFLDQQESWKALHFDTYIKGTVVNYNDYGGWGQVQLNITQVAGPNGTYSAWGVYKNGSQINYTQTVLILSPSSVGSTPTANVGGGLGLVAGDTLYFYKSQASVNPIFYQDNPLPNRDNFSTFDRVGYASFVYASRGGTNPSVPSYPVQSGDTVVKANGLYSFIETMNEPNAWWAGFDGFFNGTTLGYAWSMIYDGHKGTYPNRGAKQADPNILVSTSGLATDKLDLLYGAYDHARKNRGLKANGNVNVPWDIIQLHIYPSVGSQYAAGGGLPPEQAMFQNVKNMVWFQERYCPDSQLFVGEWGWDQHPDSPLRAGIVGTYDREIVAASWMTRAILGCSAIGLDRAQYYTLFQPWPESQSNNNSTQFATMRLLHQLDDNDPNTITRSRQGDYMAQLNEYGNYIFDSEINTGITGVYCYKYKSGASTIIALWSEEITTMVNGAPSFTERTGTFSVPVPTGSTLKIRTFQDNGSATLATTNVTATGSTYNQTYGTKPVIIEIVSSVVTPNNWTTIGHDEKRTGTSNGNIPGALSLVWSYNATSPSTGLNPWNISRGSCTSSIIGDTSGLYLRYGADTLTYSGIDKISTSGTKLWQNPIIGIDDNENMACCKTGGKIVVNDNTFTLVNDTTGAGEFISGRNTWGQICPDSNDSTALYTSNWLQLDYLGVSVSKYKIDGTLLWNALSYMGVGSGSSRDLNGSALAYENNVLYYAPRYKFSDNIAHLTSGLYALNAATGATIWLAPSNPSSHISVGASYIYLCEDNKLVARSKVDGSLVWSQTLSGTVFYNTLRPTCAQSPVLINNIVIMGTSAGLFAYNQLTGSPVWSNGSIVPYTVSQVNGYNLLRFTFMAAATTSNTLVVTANDSKIHVLNVATGSELWSGLPVTPQYYLTNPIIIGNMVYVADAGGHMIALKG